MSGVHPAFTKFNDKNILKKIIEEHDFAVNIGVTGVPALYMEGLYHALVGLQDEDVYMRIAEKALGRPTN